MPAYVLEICLTTLWHHIMCSFFLQNYPITHWRHKPWWLFAFEHEIVNHPDRRFVSNLDSFPGPAQPSAVLQVTESWAGPGNEAKTGLHQLSGNPRWQALSPFNTLPFGCWILSQNTTVGCVDLPLPYVVLYPSAADTALGHCKPDYAYLAK